MQAPITTYKSNYNRSIHLFTSIIIGQQVTNDPTVCYSTIQHKGILIYFL